MGLLDGISSALDSGAVESAVNVGSKAASNSSWWDTGIKYATDAFGWMEDHPETTNILAGVAGGVGSYLSNQQQLEQQQQFSEDQWNRERDARRIKPGSTSGYGSHVATAKGGLLTNGMIVGEED